MVAARPNSSLACTVSQFAFASHEYLRIACAPLPKLWSPRLRMATAHTLTQSRPVGALSPRATPRIPYPNVLASLTQPLLRFLDIAENVLRYV
eukprot:5879801-Pleurochrysis_carterae.AAC.2